MRFPKTLTFACLLVVGTAVGHSQTAEQQEKALRILRQMIAEKEGRAPAPKTEQPASAEPAKPAPSAQDREAAARKALEQMEADKKAKAAQPPAQAVAEPAPLTISEERERKARAALDELRRANSQPAALTAAPKQNTPAPSAKPMTDAEEQKARSALIQTYPSPAVRATPAPMAEPLPSDREARARAALEQMLAAEQTGTPTPQTGVAATSPVPTQPQVNTASQVATSTPTGQAPVVIDQKELTRKQKLQVILDLYVADQITPREYHERRAAILAGN